MKAFIILVCLLGVFGACAGVETEPALPEPEPLTPGPRVYLPLQSIFLVQIDPQSPNFERDLLVMHFDRRDSFSVRPGRLLLTSGRQTVIDPVVTVGKSDLTRADLVILRTAPQRYALREEIWQEGSFDYRNAISFSKVPEFIVFSPLFSSPLAIDAADIKDQRRGWRRSVDELVPEAQQRILASFNEEELTVLKRFLVQSRVFTDYQGISSILFLPHPQLEPDSYTDGLRIGIRLPEDFNPESPESYSRMRISAEASAMPDKSLEGITLGDMGVYSGGTVLLEPDLKRHTSNLVSMDNIQRMPGPTRIIPSPVTMSGSFNIYRDERNRILWYPGIISYIPGNHPDISEGDIQVVFDTSRRNLESSLRDSRALFYGSHLLPEGLHIFYLAAPTARALENAWEQNQEIRAALRDFLDQPAHAIRLY